MIFFNRIIKLARALRLNSSIAFPILFISYFFMVSGYDNVWKEKKIILSDGIIYYQYLTAVFQFQDPSFEFRRHLPEDFDGVVWINKEENGPYRIKMTMGVSIMLTPFYLIAAGIDKIGGYGSYGYSPLFQLFIIIAACFYMLWGLYLQQKILRRYFSETTIFFTLVFIGIGTHLMYYSCLQPGLSHTYSFFLFSALLHLVIKWHDKQTLSSAALVGLVMGLIALVRPPNVMVAIIVLLYGVHNLESLKTKTILLLKHWKQWLIAILIALFLLAGQIFFWYQVSGEYISYGYIGERFFWMKPQMIEVLFGFRTGLFVYTPILFFALVGLCIKSEKLKELKLPLVLFFLVNVYVISSWWCWWYGGSFSMRTLVESMAFMTVFMALCLEKIGGLKKIMSIPLLGLGVFFIVLNFIMTVQYKRGIIHYDSMTFKAYKNAFLDLNTGHINRDYFQAPDYKAARKGENR